MSRMHSLTKITLALIIAILFSVESYARPPIPPGESGAKAALETSPRHGEYVDVEVPGRSAPVRAYVGLGGNEGDVATTLVEALWAVDAMAQTTIQRQSWRLLPLGACTARRMQSSTTDSSTGRSRSRRRRTLRVVLSRRSVSARSNGGCSVTAPC